MAHMAGKPGRRIIRLTSNELEGLGLALIAFFGHLDGVVER